MSNLVELNFKKTREGSIEEGQGMEKTIYPDVNTFILERVVDEVRTAVIIGSKPGEKLALRIEKGQ